jgi:hypothetical protein
LDSDVKGHLSRRAICSPFVQNSQKPSQKMEATGHPLPIKTGTLASSQEQVSKFFYSKLRLKSQLKSLTIKINNGYVLYLSM